MGDDEVDPLRQALRGMWSSVAPAWEAEADAVDDRAAPVTIALLEAADVQVGHRVLELACGPGGVGLAAAQRVGDGGEVVLTDIAPEMVAAAERRAVAAGLGNVSVAVRDLERIDEPDASFDAVVCREGLMFAPEPARAAAEIRRVLRDGGRAALSVWGPRAANPWLGGLFDGLTEAIGMPVPPPGIPGPFALGEPGVLEGALREGGFAAVTVAEVAVPMLASSFDDWWDRTTALAGPVRAVLSGLPEETVEAVRSAAQVALAPHRQGDGYDLPGLVLVARAG